jgi:hypothetical protein
MSAYYPVFTLPKGLSWKYHKLAKFSNISQVPQSGRHPAASTIQNGTIFDFELNWNYLKNNGVTTSNDVQYVQEFYEAVGGGFNWFQFNPAQSNLENLTVTPDTTQLQNGFFGVADGVTTIYPLWRSTSALGGGNITTLEQIQSVTSLSGIYLNGTAVSFSTFTLSNFPSTITFNTPPTLGTVLSWEGSYCYLAQFADDTLDLEEFMFQLWELQQLKLTSVNL